MSKVGILLRATSYESLTVECQMCEGELCYSLTSAIKEYLDRPETRELLGVETPANFSACSNIVGANFEAHMDKWASPTQYYVSSLLDRGVRVLIYAGTYDWQCNWVANKLWVDKLQWSKHEAYHQTEWREWIVDGKMVGEAKQTPLLAFVTVRGAGHMMSACPDMSLLAADDLGGSYVPYDKPKEALVMVARWISHGKI
jgi:carboxypeptidase C (cathepsin A)